MKRIAMAILCTILLITGLPQGFLQEAKASSVTGQEGYTGIRTINGKKYCFKNGRKVTGMQKVGDDYYFFSGSAKGAMDGGWKIAKGHFRYFDKKTGKMQTRSMKTPTVPFCSLIWMILSGSMISWAIRREIGCCGK